MITIHVPVLTFAVRNYYCIVFIIAFEKQFTQSKNLLNKSQYMC